MNRTIFLFILLVVCSSFTCAQRVHIGAEVLLEQHLNLLANKNVGVICNQTSVLPNGVHLVDTLLKKGIKVTALFSPEHGIRGTEEAGKIFGNSIDAKTGLSIYSLYGKTRKPTAAMLQSIDVLLFDLQDVGARFYTYASTMAYAMEAAAENRKKFIALDRPNPINGIDIEGPVLDTALHSFVGLFPIPIRHGLTLGELAKMIVGEKWIRNASDLNLTVIIMIGWNRSMWYDETGLPWISPSPNMKTLSTATVYPGTCLFEATNISEGRGTAKPFEYIGAPWMNADSIIMETECLYIPGVQFEPIQFVPQKGSKYGGQECHGVYFHVTERKNFQPVQTALCLLGLIKKCNPDNFHFKKNVFDKLSGNRNIRLMLETDNAKLFTDTKKIHSPELEKYLKKIQEYKFY